MKLKRTTAYELPGGGVTLDKAEAAEAWAWEGIGEMLEDVLTEIGAADVVDAALVLGELRLNSDRFRELAEMLVRPGRGRNKPTAEDAGEPDHDPQP